MLLLIDNYDSFSYNLYQMLGSLDPDVRVIRNDVYTVADIAGMGAAGIVISPGPGRPEDAGVCEELVRTLHTRLSILGVCLGHQALCQALGATVTYAAQLMHGKQSEIHVDTTSALFATCPDRLPVARYHSLAVDAATLPDCLRVTAHTDAGEVMAVQHVDAPLMGVQFHPESIMTPHGALMLKNFQQLTKEYHQ